MKSQNILTQKPSHGGKQDLDEFIQTIKEIKWKDKVVQIPQTTIQAERDFYNKEDQQIFYKILRGNINRYWIMALRNRRDRLNNNNYYYYNYNNNWNNFIVTININKIIRIDIELSIIKTVRTQGQQHNKKEKLSKGLLKLQQKKKSQIKINHKITYIIKPACEGKVSKFMKNMIAYKTEEAKSQKIIITKDRKESISKGTLSSLDYGVRNHIGNKIQDILQGVYMMTTEDGQEESLQLINNYSHNNTFGFPRCIKKLKSETFEQVRDIGLVKSREIYAKIRNDRLDVLIKKAKKFFTKDVWEILNRRIMMERLAVDMIYLNPQAIQHDWGLLLKSNGIALEHLKKKIQICGGYQQYKILKTSLNLHFYF